MTYRLSIQQSAKKALQRIDMPVRKRIGDAIEGLAKDPRPRGFVPVINEPGAFRIRVGDYRILYEINDTELTVLVVKIAHRSTAYER